jgi:hypothetical protein
MKASEAIARAVKAEIGNTPIFALIGEPPPRRLARP